MKKLSDQDRWFIKNWAQACQFEDAMAAVRQHYDGLFAEIHERVKSKFPKLDDYIPHRLLEKVAVAEADYDHGYAGGCVVFST
jgi:hypothetical protein